MSTGSAAAPAGGEDSPAAPEAGAGAVRALLKQGKLAEAEEAIAAALAKAPARPALLRVAAAVAEQRGRSGDQPCIAVGIAARDRGRADIAVGSRP